MIGRTEPASTPTLVTMVSMSMALGAEDEAYAWERARLLPGVC